ncbi:MAG: hypothetical protein GX579_02555 [Chloroflexi bacterium]|jgi:hypothetical protein|nr:hypothetical protein [Chloroflexota bacterium]
MTETRIVSFIVRFVQPESGDRTALWHGVVRHVQSREEVRFTRVEEALQFMSRYVPMEDENAAPPAVPSSSVADEES